MLPMTWPRPIPLDIGEETHFGNRRMKCFSDRPASLDRMLVGAVALGPEREAVVEGQTRLTYGDLDDQVNRIAGNLAALGVAAGDRIAVLMANRCEYVGAVMAAARLGAISVPINIREQTPALEYVLNHCGAKVLLFEAGLADRLPPRERLSGLEHAFVIGGKAPGAVPFGELTQPSAPPPAADVHEDDTAVILYTSGTTGRPKGAMLTHLNIIHTVLHYRVCMELGPGDSTLLVVPASHVTGLCALIHTMIGIGGRTVMMREFDAAAMVELLAAERISHTMMVPAMYNLCLLRADFSQYDLSAWRIGSFGGAPMPEDTIARLAELLPDLNLMNAYGATETTSPTTCLPIGEIASRPDSVGQVVPCGEVRVVDDDGADVAAGESGELWIAGPMVVPGYWDNAEATAREFTDGYWKSGDIGSLDADGYVRVFDRKKDMIIRGGYNIYSAEIENMLSHHEDVIECAVIGRPDPVLGEKIHVFVVTEDGKLDAQSIADYCAARVSDYKVPDFFTLSAEPLPRNANGKIIKRELRERSQAGSADGGP